MRRLLSSMIVVVLLPLFVLPGFAWDKYSFVGDSVYSLRQDFALPSVQSVQAQADSSSSDSLSGFDFISAWTVADDTAAIGVQATYHLDDTIGGIDVDEDLPLMQPSTFLDVGDTHLIISSRVLILFCLVLLVFLALVQLLDIFSSMILSRLFLNFLRFLFLVH